MISSSERTWLDIIRTRRSIRRYQPRAVPREVLDEVLEAARWAPSAHNRQPWRFAVLENADTKRRLAQGMGELLKADLERGGASREVIENDVNRSFSRITGAPVVLVVCFTMREMDVYADAKRQKAEWIMAAQSAAMAVQNILLAAHAIGLGACWMCAPLFAPDVVRGILGLEADWEPQALITIGYPSESKEKTRVPLPAVVRYLDR